MSYSVANPNPPPEWFGFGQFTAGTEHCPAANPAECIGVNQANLGGFPSGNFSGVLSTIQATAGSPGTATISEAVLSWYQHMVAGCSIHGALSRMQPRFHPTLEAVLSLAIQQGRLDCVLHDIIQVYHTRVDDGELADEMSRLLTDYQAFSDGGLICHECLLRELGKVLQRVRIEQAYEVIFTQEGEEFFHHLYLGVKAVRYSEPSHSKVYTTLQKALADSADQGEPLDLNEQTWTARRLDDNRFELSTPAICVTLTFA